MQTLRELCNIPANKYLLMEMFEPKGKVADQNISEMTCQEFKQAIKEQEDQGRTWEAITIPYPYAKYVGMQEDPKGPAISIYNIVGGKRHGSTVSQETLDKEGIQIID